MDNSGASKVLVEAELSQPATAVPGPVRHRRVDPAGQDDRVREVGEELATLGNCPGHDGGCCSGKHELKKQNINNFHSDILGEDGSSHFT